MVTSVFEKKLMLKPMETPLQVSIIDDSLTDSQYLYRLLNGLSGWKIEVSIFESPDEAFENLKDKGTWRLSVQKHGGNGG